MNSVGLSDTVGIWFGILDGIAVGGGAYWVGEGGFFVGDEGGADKIVMF